jgi:hypothetical protein
MPALPAINNLRTTLSAPVGISDTTVSVVSTAGWPAAGPLSIDNEVIYYSAIVGNTFTGCVRGWDNTSAAAHTLLDPLLQPTVVNLRIIAKHINDAGFINATPTTATVGGIPAGSTFTERLTVQEMFERLLYPFQDPSFSAFAINAVASNVEVGYTLAASLTFTWTTVVPGNVQPNSLGITDVTNALTLSSGMADDGVEAIVMPGSIQKVAAGSHVFEIEGQSIHATSFTRNLTMNWMWKMFYGSSTNATLTAGDISGLSGGTLKSSYAGTYAVPAGGYKYFCFAHVAGGQINTIKDAATNFDIPMATSSDDAAYSNVDGGGYSYALVSFTNTYGVTTNYRVYRSKNSMGAAFSITIT